MTEMFRPLLLLSVYFTSFPSELSRLSLFGEAHKVSSASGTRKCLLNHTRYNSLHFPRRSKIKHLSIIYPLQYEALLLPL